MVQPSAAAAAQALALQLQATELENILNARDSGRRTPTILRRNLSYVDRSRWRTLQQGHGAALQLQLELAGGPGPSNGPAQAAIAAAGSSSSQDLGSRQVLVAALCVVAPQNGTQAYVPVSARAVRLPRERNARLCLSLPMGAARPTAGLAVVLLHPFAGDTQWRYRYHLSAEERRRWDAAAAGAQRAQPPECGQLALLATLTPALHRGSSGRSAAACSGDGTSGEGRLLEPCVTAAAAFTLLPSGSQVGYSIIPLDGLLGGSRESQGLIQRRYGVLTTHLPVSNGVSGGSAVHSLVTPWFQLGGGSSSRAGSGSEGYPPFRYSATLLSRGSSSGSGTQQQQRGGQAPPPIQQQQQQQQPEPQITYFFCSFDGGCSVRSVAGGFRCPLASCCGLRCHSYAALQQHIGSMHGYHSSYFSGLMPDGGLEVYLRCKPAWLTPKLDFLPRQLGRLDEHPLLDLLNLSHNRYPFFYHCPRWQRRRRLGPWGAAPRDAREEELERQAEAAIAARLGYAPPRPNSSAPGSSSMLSIETLSDSGTATEPAVPEEAGPAAASGQRAAKPAGGRGRGRGSGRGRGRAAAAAGSRPGSGLSLLNAAGRPKFYHSRTCVAMTRQELFGEAGQAGSDESDSEGDLAEWQRDCRERLAEHKGLCPEERAFMFDWNLFLHRQPLHADGDLPASLAAFAAAHRRQLVRDGPFRRCMVAHLLNLWRFRLLTPSQLHGLTRELPRVV